MSHSSFKLINNDEPLSHNLIIVVNKNGSVGTDTATLQNLLTSKETPMTGVTVLRETSPTPSISDEIEDERIERIDMLKQKYRDEHPNADEDEIEEHLQMISDNSIPHVTLSVENYFPPDQARKFANDVLHLGGIDNPQTLMPIDFNFRRKIVQNDHCYTPLTMSPERNENAPNSKRKEPSSLVKGARKEAKQKVRQSTTTVEDDHSGESGDDSEEEIDEEQSADDQSADDISFSESDDDNDMDFSVNDRFGKKGTKKKRKYRRQKQKNLSFKDFMLEGGSGSAAADLSSLDDEPKKKYGKVVSKKTPHSSRSAASGSKITNTPSKVVVQQTITKKVLNASEKNFKINTPQSKFVPSSTFKAATTTASGNISQISIQSAAPTKSIQEREIVESIAKDLEKSFPESNAGPSRILTTTPLKKAESIPNIMQIMEQNTSAEVLDQSLSTLEHIDASDGGASIEEIGDALIAVLGNEAIDELLNQNDLMNFEPSSTALIVKPNQVQQVPLMVDTISLSPTASPLSFSISSPLHHQLPKILNKQAPQKDPIKIMKNGRVITLPVIEAPATRGAKRRAQGEPLTPIPSTPPTTKTIRAEKTPSNKDPDSKNSSRRSSLNKSESRRQSVATQGVIDVEDEGNSDESWNSEDDPDRLWCICKQPHNNRFMICCDKCEDWFHGTCVNVTKAQGKVMEENKKKWLCPNCKTSGGGVIATKKDSFKKTLNQQKLTKFFSKHQKESTDDEEMSSANMCAVCGKSSTRIDSIYCSDECIQNHAINLTSDDTSVISTKPSIVTPYQQPQKTEVKRGNILKSQEGNVIVYEKTTEKLISSKLWPHISVLQQWLAQNPNCEPVRPGSSKANILMSNISNKKQLSSALQTPTISSTTPPIKSQTMDELFSNPVKINTGNAQTTPPAASVVASNKKLNRSESIKSPTTPHSPVSHAKGVKSNNSAQSVLPTVTRKLDDKKVKRQLSDDKPSTPSAKNSKERVELERQSVRNNLKTTIEARMKDFDHPSIAQMTTEEIEKFAKQLELEMFLFFNKDTKDKYKNKFRSLKFNLSDVKNKSLIEKICAKRLTPKQIVTLSASDLASEELAKWREDENKHQLEIITKSELDALTQNKIVVKTHKGEEIIETNPTPIEILMPGIHDIEMAISSKTTVNEDSHERHDSNKSPLSSPSISSSTSRAKRSRSRSKSRGHEHHSSHHHKSSSSSKHKKRSRSKSRSRDHHSSIRSHGSSREKSRDESKNRSKDEKYHREKNNDTDNKNSSTKLKDSKAHHHSHHHHHHHEREKDKVKVKEQPQEKKYREIEPQQEDVDLVGKILDSMGVHLDMQPKKPSDEPSVVVADAGEEKKETEGTSSDPIDSVSLIEKKVTVDPVNEHILEIEIYSGNMFMADIAKFDVTGSIVSGNVDDVMKKFSSTMEIVGRIEPKTVWDYLGKVKKLPGKELVVLRFSSTNESAYFTLFSYLHTRQRYGVIKSSSPTIKDFYLITVEANRPLPSVLLPIDGPGFIEGEEHKPDLLIGVILKVVPETKNVKKQQMKEAVKKSVKPSRQPIEHNVPIEVLPVRNKSHHHHHSGSKLVMGLPEINDNLKQSSPSPSDDEPYEPMDEDDNVQLRATPSSTSISSKLNSSDDYLESQMEQINREIEQRQMEIQKLAQQKAMELDEAQASRIYEKISVPHNLSEMLSTINASTESKPIEIDDDDDLEYVPTATTSSMHSNAEYRASSSYPVINPPIVNSMMDIDERINLFRANEMTPEQSSNQSVSRLASMSDADLMKLVPDNAFEMALPPPSVSSSNNEPAIPGLELEFSNMET